MRIPRRWKALATAIALLAIMLQPGDGAALTGGIKLPNPPSEEYLGDPDIPIGSLIVPSPVDGWLCQVLVRLRGPLLKPPASARFLRNRTHGSVTPTVIMVRDRGKR